MAGFLAFVEGNVPTFPRRKMKKMTFSYQMIDHERYLSFLTTSDSNFLPLFCIIRMSLELNNQE